jgi:hypothetical protein
MFDLALRKTFRNMPMFVTVLYLTIPLHLNGKKISIIYLGNELI